jgi:uncharacterized membrane-anchored protein YitT (DUF2179 family)
LVTGPWEIIIDWNVLVRSGFCGLVVGAGLGVLYKFTVESGGLVLVWQFCQGFIRIGFGIMEVGRFVERILSVLAGMLAMGGI